MTNAPLTTARDGAPLQVLDLVAGYGSSPAVLDGLTMNLDSGSVLALLGPNGVGKTTLLKVVAGLLDARGGDVLLEGRPLRHESPEERLRRGLALVPEGRRLFTSLSVEDNLRAAAHFRRRRVDEDLVFGYFPRLRERWRVPAGALSGGEQQMLAVARAMLTEPRVLLVDEPSLGLAPLMAATVFEALRRLADGGTSVLVAEQNLHLALSVADRAAVVSGGVVVHHAECRTPAGSAAATDAYRTVTQLGVEAV